MSGGDLSAGFPRKPTREAIVRMLREVSRAHDFAVAADRVVYQSHDDGAIERIEPDGRRTTGRFVNRRFVPDVEPRSGAS